MAASRRHRPPWPLHTEHRPFGHWQNSGFSHSTLIVADKGGYHCLTLDKDWQSMAQFHGQARSVGRFTLMTNSPSSAGDERPTIPPVISAQSSPNGSFWLRELPYAGVFVLAIFGIAYNTYSKQSIVGYWEFLALVICVVCIGSGWPHAHNRKARLRLVWTQALHWLAFLVAMNLVLLPTVQRMMDAEATSLAILMLLALGTFTAGVHILAWQICLLGLVMAVGVPASAWMERSALLLALGLLALLGIGLVSWFFIRRRGARQKEQQFVQPAPGDPRT
jgi:hypothetical protein